MPPTLWQTEIVAAGDFAPRWCRAFDALTLHRTFLAGTSDVPGAGYE